MKKTIITLLFVLTVFISTTAFVLSSKHAAGFAGFTDSPFENNCGSCHGGGSAASSGITVTALPAFTANTYIPGNTYTLSLTVAATGFNNYGFGCEILNTSNVSTGTMQNPGSGVKFLTASNGRKNAVQTSTKNGTGFTSFSFEWIAPASGTVTIFETVAAVNANGNTSGDFTFGDNLTITPAAGVGIKEFATTDIYSVSVFPNPASDFITIDYSLKKEQQLSILLLDIKGALVKEFTNEKRPGNAQSQIFSLQGVEKGVYFLKIFGEGPHTYQKLISIN